LQAAKKELFLRDKTPQKNFELKWSGEEIHLAKKREGESYGCTLPERDYEQLRPGKSPKSPSAGRSFGGGEGIWGNALGRRVVGSLIEEFSLGERNILYPRTTGVLEGRE